MSETMVEKSEGLKVLRLRWFRHGAASQENSLEVSLTASGVHLSSSRLVIDISKGSTKNT